MRTDRPLAPRSTISPLTPEELRKIARELRSAARGHPHALYAAKFIKRSDELRAEAHAIEQRRRERRWFAARVREWVKDR